MPYDFDDDDDPRDPGHDPPRTKWPALICDQAAVGRTLRSRHICHCRQPTPASQHTEHQCTCGHRWSTA
jgi:hypothetical protein